MIRRATVVDVDTGEELREITVADLVAQLPAPVRRALATLPRPLLDALGRLPRRAQTTLLELPQDVQLAIIEGLRHLAVPSLEAPPVDGGSTALVPTGATPSTSLPPDLLDFLMGNAARPAWVTRVRLATPTDVALIEGPSLELTDEQREQIRDEYATRLGTQRERPRPSGTPVTASPEVANVAAAHPARARERAEAEADQRWSDDHAEQHGNEAIEEARTTRQSDLKAAQKAVQSAMSTPTPSAGSARERRKAKNTKSPALIEAEQRVDELSQPLDEASIGQQAQQRRRDDIAQLRAAGLSRATIDGLLTAVGSDAFHSVLTLHGTAMTARIAQHLPASQAALLLGGTKSKLPATLDDAVAAALPALFGAGASVDLLLSGLRALGNQFAPLVANAPAACIRLLRVNDLHRLTTFCRGGAITDLVSLAGRLDPAALTRVLKVVPSAAELHTLCGAGPVPVASIMSLNVGDATLGTWCSMPTLISTLTVLSDPGLAGLLAPLQALALCDSGPSQLVLALQAHVPATVIAATVARAPSLLANATEAVQYLVAHPTDTDDEFAEDRAQQAATAASVRPVSLGTATAASGATYTKWSHSATIDSPTLMMLLNEGYARVSYGSTFTTVTEQSNGGDTEEYFVETWDGTTWVTRWVVHLHRSRGSSKKDAPSAAHIKRWEERKLKDAKRIHVDTTLAARCRTTHP